MCDYSLHNVASRPAKVGDKLVTTTFCNTNTRGLADVEQPWVAVCLRPGTELNFEAPTRKPRWYHGLLDPFRVLHRVRSGGRAIFVEANKGRRRVHHDAVEFTNGKVRLVHNLAPGQHVTVLQLPIDPRKPWVPPAPGQGVGRSQDHLLMPVD